MKELSLTTAVTMSSLEIAELTGKQHSHVMRDIRNMLESFSANPDLDWHCESSTYIDAQGKHREMYLLDKDTSITLLAGYDVVARHKIVKRWQELETKEVTANATQVLTKEIQASYALQAHLHAASLLACPLHLAQIESIKQVEKAHGVDFSVHLLSAPAQNNIVPEEVMLEPTELGKRLGYTARAMNVVLSKAGLQAKADGYWIPTEQGEPMCTKHSWKKGSKAGYNLKWNLLSVKKHLNVE